VNNQTSGPKNNGPTSGLVQSKSVQGLIQPWFEQLAAHLKYPAGKNPVITSQQQKSSTAISCTAKKQGRR
jgi:hypothetical protein